MRRVLVLIASCLMLGASPPVTQPTATKGLSKTRPGSFLQKPKLWDDPPDLRSASERQRDEELYTHYRRLAELDVLGKIAETTGDDALAERAEDVRRKEMQRHHRAMMDAHVEHRTQAIGGIVP